MSKSLIRRVRDGVEGGVYIFIYIYTHTHIHICIYIYMSLLVVYNIKSPFLELKLRSSLAFGISWQNFSSNPDKTKPTNLTFETIK